MTDGIGFHGPEAATPADAARQEPSSGPDEAATTPAAAVVEIGPASPRRFALLEVTTIGRDAGSVIRIDDPLVGRRHAEIRRTGDGTYELVDLGSRGGTYVRGRRVSTTVLQHGDELLVGPVRLRFEQGAPVGERPARTRLPPASDARAGAAIELTGALEKAADLRGMLEALLRTALEVVEAERGAVLLIGEDESQPSLQIGLTRDGAPAEIQLSTSLLNEVVTRDGGVLITSVPDDPRLTDAMSLVAQKVRSAICVPLKHRDERLGVLHLDSRVGGAFTSANLDLVSAMARQASVAIRNAVLLEKVRSSEALERRRLEGLVGDLPDGVLLVERDGRIAFANRRAPELLALVNTPGEGRVLERLGGLSIGDLLASREPAEIVTAGSPKRVLLASAHESSGGVAGMVLVVLRDVTSEREREARLAHQERLAVIGQLAAGVAHDFNNLLAVITSFAQFVMDDLTAPRQRDDQQQVLEAAARASQLVKQLLTLGRRELVRPQVVRLDRVIASLERLVRNSVGEPIQVRTTFAPDLYRVKLDPSMFGQVVLNFAVNARDAMPLGGSLTLRAFNRELPASEARAEGLAAGRYVALEIADTGTGMADHVASRVFEPFFTTKGAGMGTGLGLATAYGVVKQAGGTIQLRTKQGEGTTFTVLLPATDEADGDADGPRPRSGCRGETILLVEDELLIRNLTRRILTDAGYRVLEAGSGDEALELSASHAGKIDLLLTDVIMPNMSGKQVMERLAAERPDVRVLYMSGYFDDAMGADILRHFIAKPFHRDALLDRVRAALTRPAP